jgi:hypothetical protein
VLELGLGLPAWNKIGAHQAVQPFTFRATGAEPHSVQFAIPARVKIPSWQRVPASMPVRWVGRRNNQYPGLWRSGLDEHELQVGAAPTRNRPARGPHLVVRQGKASGTKLPLKLPAMRRECHQVQILVRSGPAADKEVHRYSTGQPHRRRDASESAENVEDHDWLDAHASIITWAESQANGCVGALRWLVVGPPKTRVSRRKVSLPLGVMEELAIHLRAPGRPTDQVFKALGGGQLRISNFRCKIWRPAVADANLAGLRIHDLRHMAVALWIAAGASPKEVAARAGHTSVSFVLDRYGHLFPEADTALRARLDLLFRGATEQRRNTVA